MNKNKVKQAHKGRGSYGYVNKVKDCDLGIVYAEKHLDLSSANSKDKKRFKQEFKIMKKYNHENLVKSYSIDTDNYTYIMEYCDSTLYDYIRANNTKLDFSERIDIANQFLKGLSFIHNKGVLHRDLSFKNVMIKKYDDCVKVKISDFGLAKDILEPLTSTKSDKNRGTFIDPLLDNFKDFNIQNEIFAVGHILHYIFRGKTSLNLEDEENDELKEIIRKCTSLASLKKRYQNVNEIIDDISNLENKSVNKKMESPRVINKLINKDKYLMEILSAVYNSNENDIWYSKDVVSERLETDGLNINLSAISNREKEMYISVINELLKKGLIRLEVNERNTREYKLTTSGYEFYEKYYKD